MTFQNFHRYSSNNSSIKKFADSPNSTRGYRTSLVPKRPVHFDYFRRKLTKERKAFLCLFSISVGLISSWLLFLIMWPLRIICNSCVSEVLFTISVWSNYSSAAANPLILLIFHSKFQNELVTIIRSLKSYFERPLDWTLLETQLKVADIQYNIENGSSYGHVKGTFMACVYFLLEILRGLFLL